MKTYWQCSNRKNLWLKVLLTALMPLIFIWIVQTIIITITDVDTRNAVPIITGEQITEAGPTFRLAVLWWFVRPISAIIITVTIPRSWDTTVIWAPAQISLIYTFYFWSIYWWCQQLWLCTAQCECLWTSMFGTFNFPLSLIFHPLFWPFKTWSNELEWDHMADKSASPTPVKFCH